MGVQDLDRIHPIYRSAVEFCKLANLPFTFKVDSGNFETAIEFFTEHHCVHPPYSSDWKDTTIFCPDILDYEHKIIVEFEEETGDRKSGAHMAKKGHGHSGDLDGKRDSRRNEYYSQAGFKVLRIWESNESWKITLFEFLIQCWKESQ